MISGGSGSTVKVPVTFNVSRNATSPWTRKLGFVPDRFSFIQLQDDL